MLRRQLHTLQFRAFEFFHSAALTVIGRNFNVTGRDSLVFGYGEGHRCIHTSISVNRGKVRGQASPATAHDMGGNPGARTPGLRLTQYRELPPPERALSCASLVLRARPSKSFPFSACIARVASAFDISTNPK